MTHPWTAAMIAPDNDFGGSPRLRGEIRLASGHGPAVRAELLVSSQGIFEAYLGGERVDDDVLSPGWSSYEWRLRYRAYDVRDRVSTASASADPLVLAIVLGNGWYRGRLGFLGNRAVYGTELAAIAQLEIEFADGHVQVEGTNASWRAGPSPVTANDLYDGQSIDARRQDDTWLQPGAPLIGWTGVHAVEFDTGRLTPYLGPVVRRQEQLAPTRIWTSPAGRTLVDFGQNLTGWVRLRARGEAGRTITLRHAEVLENDELGTRPLRTAQATDRFVLSGNDDEFEPTQTFHGFRYVEVDGYPGTLHASDLAAVVVHSDLRRTGTFRCSNPLLNRLHENVVWSQRGNFLDVPTDCPQRDERLGWTGDLAVFAPTAAYLYDVSGFLDDWLADLAVEQSHAHGRVGFVVPDNLKYDPPQKVLPPQPESTAIWSDAAVWVPWALWQAYGDQAALGRHYPAMTAHVHHVQTLLSSNYLWDKGFQFGDWLDPTAPPESPFDAKADTGVVATACYYRTLVTTAQTARLLGHSNDAEAFETLGAQVRAAFVEHYVSPDGIVLSDCPTVYALAIVFGLLDEERQALAGNRLAELSEKGGFKVATGFAGTPYVLDALTSTGHLDVAYRMLTERDCPSWLYPVIMGATTIWERWDSMLPDGSINPGEMTSFNHYALGAVADWIHRTIGGIAPLEPGYRRALIAPQPGGGITSADAALNTPLGHLRVHWTAHDSGQLDTITVDIPDGMTAVLRRPGREDLELTPGRHEITPPS